MVIPTTQAATMNSPSLRGIQIFPKDNIWNVPVDTLPVETRSANYVTTIGRSQHLSYYFGFPYNVVDSMQAKQKFSTLSSAYYSNNVAYPIPSNPLIEDLCADLHMIIIDRDYHKLYETYDTHKGSNGPWSAGIGTVWNMSGNSFRKNNVTPMWSADTAGLPVFPGLLIYDEVSSGEIKHALRFAVPSMRGDYVWPACASAPWGLIKDQNYPPAGQRFRLKASFDISGYPPQAKVILTSLKKYGMIVADNNGQWSLSGVPDSRWNTNDIYSVYNTVHGSDFEAVDESSLMIDKNSAQARTTPRIITASASAKIPPTAQFTANKTQGRVPLAVQFNDQSISTGPTSFIWDMNNDGVVDYTSKNPVRTFQTPGWYSIKLTVTDAAGTDSESKTYYIRAYGIDVVSPNSGESWSRGSLHSIKWNYVGDASNVGTTVKIELLKGGVLNRMISTSTSIGSTMGVGSFSWTVPTTQAPGSDYKIRITSTGNSAYSDLSSVAFTIS